MKNKNDGYEPTSTTELQLGADQALHVDGPKKLTRR